MRDLDRELRQFVDEAIRGEMLSQMRAVVNNLAPHHGQCPSLYNTLITQADNAPYGHLGFTNDRWRDDVQSLVKEIPTQLDSFLVDLITETIQKLVVLHEEATELEGQGALKLLVSCLEERDGDF